MKELNKKYKNKHAISQLAITNYDIQKRFDGINKIRPYAKKIKPYNFATVGTTCRTDHDTKELIIPFLSEIKRLDEIPYMKFLDYKTGKKYPMIIPCSLILLEKHGIRLGGIYRAQGVKIGR